MHFFFLVFIIYQCQILRLKYLKSSSFKFDARVSSEPMLIVCLLTIMLMHLSTPLGITSISTLKLFNSLKIMCSTSVVPINAAPLNLPVT